jgi:hypothetical protein
VPAGFCGTVLVPKHNAYIHYQQTSKWQYFMKKWLKTSFHEDMIKERFQIHITTLYIRTLLGGDWCWGRAAQRPVHYYKDGFIQW